MRACVKPQGHRGHRKAIELTEVDLPVELSREREKFVDVEIAWRPSLYG